ncbi:hypothetical protein A3Q56_06890 [Intoshia linei]|uniref:Uncharacterized protein n=1 Tax=Intoshia linei TaxID=1819745 RepID=A0A177ATQ5_9BILA|nr:hypothetical protein A3Q56_06890 [Intoshia linei]
MLENTITSLTFQNTSVDRDILKAHIPIESYIVERRQTENSKSAIAKLRNEINNQNNTIHAFRTNEIKLNDKVSTYEKVIIEKNDLIDMYTRKLIEYNQEIENLGRVNRSISAELAIAQHSLTSKTIILEKQIFENDKLREECKIMRRKLRRFLNGRKKKNIYKYVKFVIVIVIRIYKNIKKSNNSFNIDNRTVFNSVLTSKEEYFYIIDVGMNNISAVVRKENVLNFRKLIKFHSIFAYS